MKFTKKKFFIEDNKGEIVDIFNKKCFKCDLIHNENIPNYIFDVYNEKVYNIFYNVKINFNGKKNNLYYCFIKMTKPIDLKTFYIIVEIVIKHDIYLIPYCYNENTCEIFIFLF